MKKIVFTVMIISLFSHSCISSELHNLAKLERAHEGGLVHQAEELLISSNPYSYYNFEDELGKTPLDYAVANGYYSLAHLFLEHGANPSKIDFDILLPDIVRNRNLKLLKYLIENNLVDKKKLPLFQVLDLSDRRIFNLFLEHGVDVNQANDLGYTPLYLAVMYGERENVQALVRQGALINLTLPRHDNTSAWELALELRHRGQPYEEIFQFLNRENAQQSLRELQLLWDHNDDEDELDF